MHIDRKLTDEKYGTNINLHFCGFYNKDTVVRVLHEYIPNYIIFCSLPPLCYRLLIKMSCTAQGIIFDTA